MVELLTLTLNAFLSILNKHWIYTCAWPWSWIPTIFFGQPKTRILWQQDGITVVQAFYTFYIAILLDLEEKLYRESLNYIQKKNCTLEKPMRVGYYVILLKAEQTVGDKRNIKYKIWKRWFKECTTFLQCTLNTATQYEKQTITLNLNRKIEIKEHLKK